MGLSLKATMYFSSLLSFLTVLCISTARVLPPNYDIVWTTPAPVFNGSSSSMPVGGGDISLNVWVENGTILFYIGKDGCFDKNNSLLKLGRVRLALDPNPFDESQVFEQRLALEDGYIQLRGGDDALVKIWVDVFNPVIHVEVATSKATYLTSSLEVWRHKDHLMSMQEQSQSSWNGMKHIHATTWLDNATFSHGNSVLASHRNRDSRVFDATLNQQHLTDYEKELYNPLVNNTFGTMMQGIGFEPAGVSECF